MVVRRISYYFSFNIDCIFYGGVGGIIMNIDDALAVRLCVYKNTWIDYDSIEKCLMSMDGK